MTTGNDRQAGGRRIAGFGRRATPLLRFMFPMFPGATAIVACRTPYRLPEAVPTSTDQKLELGRSEPAVELVALPAGPDLPRPFLIGRYEITQEQYRAFTRATGYDGAAHPSSKTIESFLQNWTWEEASDGRRIRPISFPDGQAAHPACLLNWHHAQAFCEWASRASGRTVRLPTDQEWTWAARGPENRVYPWGDAWEPGRCNWGEGGRLDGFAESAPVGSFPRGATPEGVHDLAGNIWEWTAEQHLRGGPWCMTPDWCRCDFMAAEAITRADDKFGFRIVVEP